ncbi:PcfK-like domain protein [Streptococcus pyogenes GA03455]|nr:PcfK-like domain protein [Streptococcus pyogenes GA03455]
MDELKEKALSKMLDEMNKKHSAAEDAIHNWLSDQDDEELFKGILDDKKSIKDAMKYCINQAQKQKQVIAPWLTIKQYSVGSVCISLEKPKRSNQFKQLSQLAKKIRKLYQRKIKIKRCG